MIVKTIGQKLLINTKLYILLYKISPIIILLCPLLLLQLSQFQQQNDFQEPSLRTKIYAYTNSETIQKPIFDHQFNVSVTSVSGLISGQCLLVTFVDTTYQRDMVSILYDALKNQRVLTKSVMFVGYKNKHQLQKWLINYQSGETKYHNLGVIRAALNLDISQPATGLYLQMYGDNGRHPDTDYYYSLVELMNRLRIKFKPCETKSTYFNKIVSLLPISKGSADFGLLNNLACSLKLNQSAHAVLLPRGIQSSTLRSVFQKQQALKQTQIISLVFSWLKQFSLQQDNLHSSYTLWSPTIKNSYITLKFYIIPYVVFLVFLEINLLCRYILQNMSLQSYQLKLTDLLFLALSVSGVCIKPGIYLIFLYFLLLFSKVFYAKRSKQEMKLLKMMIVLLSSLAGLYNSILFVAATLFSYIGTLILLLPQNFVRILTIIAFGTYVYLNSFSQLLLLMSQQIQKQNLCLLPLFFIVMYCLL